MNEPRARHQARSAHAKGVSVEWTETLDRFWVHREHPSGYEDHDLQVRLDPDGSVSIFLNREEHHSTIQSRNLSYDEFFKKIRETFFPEASRGTNTHADV